MYVIKIEFLHIFKYILSLDHMVEKRRYHFNVGEVKSEIIELLLRYKGLIKEPFIRKSLHEKYDGIDQGTVNRHFHGLQKLGCLDLIPPSKNKTRKNRWNISTLKKLEKLGITSQI